VSRPSFLSRLFPRFTRKIREAAQRETIQAITERVRGGFIGQKWDGGLSTPTPNIVIDHAGLRRQARTITQTSQQAASIINRDVDITVDSGMVFVPEPRYDILGITPEEAEQWASRVSDIIELWAQSKDQSRSGMYNFYQAQRLMRRYRARDNECFVRHYYSQDPGLISPVQFEVLDPDMIREDAYTSLSYHMTDYVDGIERDGMGRECGYKIWQQVPGSHRYEAVTIPRIGPKSGRTFMTHGFDPEYAGQTRGFSSLGISVQELEDLLDFTSADIKKAINQSNIYMYGESSSDDPVVDPLRDIQDLGSGPAAARFGSSPTDVPEGEAAPPLASYQAIREATITTPGSVGIFNMPGKQTLKPFQNTAPTESYDKFVDAYFAYIAAAQGIPIEVVLMRFSQNYSASRATLILAWRIAVQRRYQMACDHFNPIIEMVLDCEIAAGRLSAPGWQDPRLRAAWLSGRWVGSPMPNIDPVQTMKASALAAKLGATTLDDVATDYNGSSGKSNRAKLAREYQELPRAPFDPAAEPDDSPSPTSDKQDAA
jgi:capsid protein